MSSSRPRQGSWVEQGNALFEHCRTLFDSIRSILARSDTEKRSRKRCRPNSPSIEGDSRKRCRREQNFPSIKALYTTKSSPPPPESDCITLDRYLQTIPSVVERVKELHSRVRNLSSQTTPNLKIINVLQGEIAHATAQHADVIVSDRATTCHIVAVRSNLVDTDCENALVSLFHIDHPGPGYEDCLRGMVQLHKAHHNIRTCTDNEEKKESDGATGKHIIMDLHILGGFSDRKKSSLALTEYLIDLFGRLADEEQDSVLFSVKTCAVSCLNDDGFGAPIGRGLAMDLRSGEVFLASVDSSVAGPAIELRNARLWAGASGQTLSVIHTPSSDTLAVEPFYFCWSLDFHEIMELPDEDMLLETSTSPDVEESDYCDQVRASLRYVRDNDAESVFGPKCNSPLQYIRSKTNEWKVNK